VNLAIAETILKKYALRELFSPEVANAHRKGMIYLHDLGFPVRVYCSAHSLEYIKKYGLNLMNLSTVSKPANHADTLTGHLNTFLASMQAYYAGALGLAYLNIFYAPYFVGVPYNYGEYTKETQLFAKALMEVWLEGDAQGVVFPFPKFDLHIIQALTISM